MTENELKRVYIYKIENAKNGKVYIGSSVNPSARWATERSSCHNLHLKRAFEKYGLENFDFQVIAAVLCASQRDFAESEVIAQYEAIDPRHGYNKVSGGRSSQWSPERRAAAKGRRPACAGRACSAETKLKISRATKGVPKSPETRQKMSIAMTRIRSEKNWKSRSGSRPSYKHTERTKRKISQSSRGRKKPLEWRLRMSARRLVEEENKRAAYARLDRGI